MKRSIGCGLVVVVTLWVAGCDPVYYVPNTHNVPLLTKKGEGVLSAIGAEHRGEIHGAYATSSHYAVVFNGVYVQPKDDEEGDGGKGLFVESGVGYFNKLFPHVIWENYGLLGFGALENHFPSSVVNDPSTTGKIHANFFRYGIQPSIAFRSRFLDVAGSVRLVGLHYWAVKGNLIFDTENQISYLKNHSEQFLAEPAITVRVGYDPIKLQLQLGGSRNLTDSKFRQEKNYLTFGVLYNF